MTDIRRKITLRRRYMFFMLLTFASLLSNSHHFMVTMLGINAVVWNLSIMALSTEIREIRTTQQEDT